MPTLRQWAGDNLIGVSPSGSFMKGTAVRSGTDIDLFISLSEHTNETLKEVYNKLFDCLTSAGYSPRRQNVSLNITVSKYSVDLVPAKRQNALSRLVPQVRVLRLDANLGPGVTAERAWRH